MDSKSKLYCLGVAFWLLASCKGGNYSVGEIGTKLDELSSFYSVDGQDAGFVFVADKPTSRILKVKLDTFTLEKAIPWATSSSSDHVLAAKPDGSYVIDFSKKHLEIIKDNGERKAKPFSFQGEATSAAYQPTTGYLVMQDNLRSVGILKLNNAGDVESSWLSGGLVADDKNIRAGDLNRLGRLILSVSDSSFLVVDLETTLAQSAWSYTSFSSDLTNISWVAPDPGFDHLLLARSDEKISLVNTTTQAVVTTYSIPLGSAVYASKFGKPHVIIQSSAAENTLLYLGSDGSLKEHELPSTYGTLPTYKASSLSSDGTALTLLGTGTSLQQVYAVRLSDNLVTLDRSFNMTLDSSKESVTLGDGFLFYKRDSALGCLQKYDLESGGLQELKGFNFDYYRN